MRLYLSSFRVGDHADKLHELLQGGTRVALIANAMDFLEGEARAASVNQEVERLTAIGLEPIEVDLREYFGKPDAQELKEKLSQFDLVWARGGDGLVLMRAFRQSGMDKALKELLADDAVVYGGYSAGICVLTPTLHGVELVDGPYVAPKGYDTAVAWDGLSIVPYAVAPHYKSDHPESERIDDMVQYLTDNNIPFKTLRDGEVIIRNGGAEITAPRLAAS